MGKHTVVQQKVCVSLLIHLNTSEATGFTKLQHELSAVESAAYKHEAS